MKAYKHIPTDNIFKLRGDYYTDDRRDYKIPIYLVEKSNDFEPYEFPKNYEILTMINDENIILKYNDELLNSTDFKIHSVKRISDQCIFTLLDTIKPYEDITGFYLNEDEDRLTTYTTYSVKSLQDLQHLKNEWDGFYGYVCYKMINSSIEKKTFFKYKSSFEFQMASMHTVKYLKGYFIKSVDHMGNTYSINKIDSTAEILEIINPR